MDIARATLGWFAANAASAIVNFLAVVYFSRKLGASILGTYFLFFSILQVLNFLANGGLSPATIKRISEGGDIPKLLSASLVMRVMCFLVISLIILLFKNSLESYLNTDLVIPIVLILFLLQFLDLIREFLQGTYRVGISALVDFVQQLSKVTAQVILLTYELSGLILGLGIGVVLSIVFGFRVARPKFKMPQWCDFLSLFQFSKYSYGIALGGLAYDWLGLLAIGFYLDSATVGIYGVCWGLSAVFLLFSQAIASSIYPRVSSLAARNKFEEISAIFGYSISYGPFLAMPAFFGTLAIGRSLLSLVYGTEFEAGATILTVLMAARIIQSVQMVITRTLEGLNRPDIVFKVNLVTTLLSVISTISLVILLGPVGAAFGVLITVFVSASCNLLMLRRTLTFKIKHELFFALISSVLMFEVVEFGQSYINLENISQLVLLIIMGACIYFATFITFSSDLRNRIFCLRQKY